MSSGSGRAGLHTASPVHAASADAERGQNLSPRSHKLSVLEGELQAPDAIMESGAFQLAKKYIMEAGGQPAKAVSLLTDGYVGYAAMANALCSWLREADRHGDGPTKYYRARQAAMSAADNPRSMPAGLPNVPPHSGLPPSVAGPGPTAAGGRSGPDLLTSPDDFAFLSELVLEKFEGYTFLRSFGRGQAPVFMEGLIADRRGRQLIYDLCHKHKHEHTALLNWAITKIVSQGLSEEVAAAGVSLMGYFSVFHQMLVNRLMKANACGSSQQLQRLSQEVQDACIRSEHTYVYAQLFLHKLSEAEAVAALQHEAQLVALEAAGLEPEEEERQLAIAPGVYRRMAQDVDEALIAQGLGAKVWAMQPLLLPPDTSPAYSRATHLVSRLLSICYSLGAVTHTPADSSNSSSSSSSVWGHVRLEALREPRHAAVLQQLLEVYGAAEGAGAGCVPLQPLRQRYCLDLLLCGVFAGIVPGSILLPANVVDNCRQLLALAVAAEERWQLQQVPPSQAPSEDLPGATPAAGSSGATSFSRTLLVVDSSSVPEAAAMLTASQETARALLKGLRLDEATEAHMRMACCLRVAALGLVRVARGVLGSSDHYSDDKCKLSWPSYVDLLRCAGERQPGLVPQVLLCCRAALVAMGRERGDLAARVVDLLVALLLAGHVAGVCDTLHSWAKQGAEPSLLRSFIVKVLGQIQPPYSAEFAGRMLWLMEHSSIERAINADNRGRFREFAEECNEVNFPMPLTMEEQQQLDRLRA